MKGEFGMKNWESPELITLDLTETQQYGTPIDGEDSQWFDQPAGMWMCEFGKERVS